MVNAIIDVTDKYVRVRIKDPSRFKPKSFRTITISRNKGIKAIIGKLKGENSTTVQAYLFLKSKGWDKNKSMDWVREHKSEKGELNVNKVLLTASCHLVNASGQLIERDIAIAGKELDMDKTRIFFKTVEFVHAGLNDNDDFFEEEDLVKSFKTVEHQLIDWEHIRWEILGSTTLAELIPQRADVPLGVAVGGVLWRESPAMLWGGREDKIVSRYNRGELFVSMECFFDKSRCKLDDFESDDPIAFHEHRMGHKEFLDKGRKAPRVLVNPHFAGVGITEFPADKKAEVKSSQASEERAVFVYFDNKTLPLELTNVSTVPKYFEYSSGTSLSDKRIQVRIISGEEENTKDKELQNKLNDLKKGEIMLNEKLKDQNFDSNSIFKVLYECYAEISKDDKTPSEDKETKVNDLFESFSDKVRNKFDEKDFNIEIFTKADIVSKMEIDISSLKQSLESEQKKNSEISQELTKKSDELKSLSEKVSELTKQVETEKQAKKDKEIESKIEDVLRTLESKGVVVKNSREVIIRQLKPIIEDSNAVEKVIVDIVATYTGIALNTASGNAPNTVGSGTKKSVLPNLDAVQEKYNQKDKN